MKVYDYGCDAGSVMFGTDDFKAHFSNGIGDGGYYIYIGENTKDQEIENLLRSYKWHFIDCVEGKFNVYDYDCGGASVLTTLEGRYAVYCHDGDILLEKWEN